MTGGSLIKWFVFMAGMILIVMSCNSQPKPDPKSKVVSKKIVAAQNPEPSQKPEGPDAKKINAAAIEKLPVNESKPLASVEKDDDDKPSQKTSSPEEQKTEPTGAQGTTVNVQSKEGKKPDVMISETARMKLSAQDIPMYNPTGRIDPFVPLIKSKDQRKPVQKKKESLK